MKFQRTIMVKITITIAITLLVATALRANQINDQVVALTESQRQTILARIMEREGEKCPSINRTFFQGKSKDGAAFWSVSCTGGKDWQIMIKNTAQGDIKILDCRALKAVGGGTCFSVFKTK